jgi:hypothetical protein
MALVLPSLLCLASGFLLVCLGWPRKTFSAANLLLQFSLSAGYGLGVFSLIYFLARVIGIAKLILFDVGVVALLLTVFLLLRPRFAASEPELQRASTGPLWLDRLLAISFGVSLVAALYAATMRAFAHPHGDGWDAFAIWNLHARFLFLGGANWRDGFSALIEWSHPDYPLLLPAVIAHFWTFLKTDHPAVPAVIGLIFTFATAGLLCSSLWTLRGWRTAALGGITLLTTPAIIEVGVWQYADIPLAFFFLAVVALLCIHDDDGASSSHRYFGVLFLAGIAAGFAAWTKNEGLLFFCSILMARLWILLRHAAQREKTGKNGFGVFLAAAAPALIVLFYFKRVVAPPSDLFSDPTTTLHKLLTVSRYWAVIKWFAKEFLRFGHWMVPATILLPGYFWAFGKDRSGTRSLNFRTCVLALALTFTGYFFIYLITPYPIYWHLRYSLDRLFLQLWPSTIFLFFLSIKARDVPNTAPC